MFLFKYHKRCLSVKKINYKSNEKITLISFVGAFWSYSQFAGHGFTEMQISPTEYNFGVFKEEGRLLTLL